MKIIKDLGMKFATKKSNKKTRFVLCECPICKKQFEVNKYNVINGKSKRCKSCATTKRNTSHNMSHSRIYNIWMNMKQRCNNENNTRYKDYGGRGIILCKEWDKSFENFYEWANSNGYSETLTIERINNDGIYCPDNCKWITIEAQAKNKRFRPIRENNNKYRGVRKIGVRWEARKTILGRCISLGYFKTRDEAKIKFNSFERNICSISKDKIEDAILRFV